MSRLQSALLRQGLTVEYASIVWMTVESLVALSVGFGTSSLALLAFGGDSVIELISSWTVLVYLRRKDTTETVQDERAEWITTLLLFLLVPMISFGLIYNYLMGIRAESSVLGIGLAIGSVIIMPGLAVEKKRVGDKSNLLPLSIDAVESWTCFFMSIALLGGLLANYLWNFWWVDSVATCIILVFILREALEALEEVRK
jgi:divalent metal cation (Fe/Co/Zn/Cd) transporter